MDSWKTKRTAICLRALPRPPCPPLFTIHMPGPAAQQLLLCRVALLESVLARHGVAVPAASAATRAACAVDAADERGCTTLW